MLVTISQLDVMFDGMWADMWASVEEFGDVPQTYIYIRYPYHLGMRLDTVAHILSTVKANHSHQFSARVMTEGRTPLYQPKGISHHGSLTSMAEDRLHQVNKQ